MLDRLVEGPNLRLLARPATVYDLALAAINAGRGLAELAAESQSSQSLEYDAVYELRSPWQLLAPFDHPQEPARCLITGTGLTHKASADNRQAMIQWHREHDKRPGAPAPGP